MLGFTGNRATVSGLLKRAAELLKMEIYTGAVPRTVVYAFTRKFSVMTGAGIDISGALDVLAMQETDARFKKIIEQTALSVRRGESFSSALGKYPEAFSPLYTGLVRAAESGGEMGEIMADFADSLQKSEVFVKKVRAAMVYPLTVVVTSVLVLFLAMSFLVPVFAQVFSDMQAPLPALTRAVVGAAVFMKSNLAYIAVFTALSVIVPIVLYRRGGRATMFFDRALFFVPVLGAMAHRSILARFCRTLASLLRGGVPLVSALEVVSSSSDNRFFSSAVIAAARKMVRGRGVAESFGSERLFPAVFVSMVDAGERSGKLPRMLEWLAESYQQEADLLSLSVQSSVESVATLIVGVAVSVIVISMYLPILSLVSLFSG
ncbi:type II secretion system F family protein [Candidatus Mycalebacterium sp.]